MAGHYLIRGERVPALDIDDLTLAESRRLQQMCGDRPLGEIINLIGLGDVNVTAGLMIFSILHHQPGSTFDDVERRVGDLAWKDFEHVLPQTEKPAEEDEESAGPPTLMPVDSGDRSSSTVSA